jgi:hypothetical protein
MGGGVNMAATTGFDGVLGKESKKKNTNSVEVNICQWDTYLGALYWSCRANRSRLM